ncbi:DUF1569 domain-containing protein [Polaribacter sp. Hel_I_88]|uniref:DUF1569 domain-containing protein n=1 Tax=Polaribacter sp. Hel_I_88 TaxID=1250006 RepID=UPI00047988DB|nr:DUF1569 domain-containing protein [Polaribacter sp. Hel_I_88]
MLEKELKFIEDSIQFKELKNLIVSKATVGWHLDHSLKVLNSVLLAIKESDPNLYKKKFNSVRFITFTLGKFPRGKVKAPKRVLPPEIIETEVIENQLEEVKSKLKYMNELEENQFFDHPFFDHLNKKQTIKFLGMHTNHHLKIIKDILK